MPATEEYGLVPVEKINAVTLFRKGVGVDEIINYVKERAYEVPQDISTAKSRDAMKSQAYQIARSKTFIEGIGKAEVDEMKKETRQIDSVRKRIKDALDQIRDEYRQPLTDFETAEKERVDRITDAILNIKAMAVNTEPDGELCNSLTLKAKLRVVEGKLADYDWDEFADEAEATHAECISKLLSYIEQAEKREHEAAELEKLRKEAAEREEADRQAKLEQERKERDERIAREAAEKAKREAEETAKREKEEAERKIREAEEAKAKAERDRIATEERARAEAEAADRRQKEAIAEAERKVREETEQKERDRLAEEARAKAEEKKKAANKRHQSHVQNNAVSAFVGYGIDKNTALRIISLIHDSKIPGVSINY